MNVDKLDKSLIDVDAISKVSEDIITKLQKKSSDYSKTDLTKFTRQSLGIDLYSQKQDISVQRQVAITSSGVFEQNWAQSSVEMLNSFAAQQMYSSMTYDNVGGKVAIDYNPGSIEFISQTEDAANPVNFVEIEKNKREFNPFYFGDFSSSTNSEQE